MFHPCQPPSPPPPSPLPSPPSPDLLGALVRGDPNGHAGAELPAKQVHHLRALASSKGSAVAAAVMAPWPGQPLPGRGALVLRHIPLLQVLLGPGSAHHCAGTAQPPWLPARAAAHSLPPTKPCAGHCRVVGCAQAAVSCAAVNSPRSARRWSRSGAGRRHPAGRCGTPRRSPPALR